MSDRVDIVTSTMGKALGGASGGFTAGRREIVEYLRQRSRPYLFSNTLAPPIVVGALKALDMIESQPHLRETLWENTAHFRGSMVDLGFEILPGTHPIVPIMLRDELKTVELAKAVNERGVFVVAFSFPVVPRGEARIRVQAFGGPHEGADRYGAVRVRRGGQGGRRDLSFSSSRTTIAGKCQE